MTEDENRVKDAHPVLLCFDGSTDAATAIAKAGELLGPRTAVMLTVWEPVAVWAPYDPATILTALVSKLTSKELSLDEIASQIARQTSDRGVVLARAAGFEVRGSVAEGKIWRAICDEAEKLDAEPIVVGARGLSRVQSAFLGSVSSAVVVHAHRPVLVIPGRTSARPVSGRRMAAESGPLQSPDPSALALSLLTASLPCTQGDGTNVPGWPVWAGGSLRRMPPVWIGLTLGFASALVTNTAYSLEHDAAAAMPPLSPRRPFRSAELLLRNRRWLTAFAAETAGWLMYVAALRLAPLASLCRLCV